ncbi:MAG: ankyrin repeat domain-containing protein [Candidatus Dependentiae bacterium]|nr:ankyrin repeat domain-containing protein [Candidatus Dependentiae bacterium]
MKRSRSNIIIYIKSCCRVTNFKRLLGKIMSDKRINKRVNDYDHVTGRTPFMDAVCFGNKDEVIALLSAGAKINLQSTNEGSDPSGSTALMYAAERGYKEIVDILIKAGANVNIRNSIGRTAIMFRSSQDRSPDLGKWFAISKKGEDYKDIIDTLIKAGAEVNAQDEDGRTALILTIVWVHPYAEWVVNALLKAGADVNIRDKSGQSAFAYSTHGYPFSRSDDIIAAALINHGVDDLSFKDRYGQTALMNACVFGGRDTVAALIKAGVDLNVPDQNGQTALMKVVERNEQLVDQGNGVVWRYEDVLDALLKAGADVNVQDKNGQTALMKAACGGKESMVMALLLVGADTTITDKHGDTAEMFAMKSDHSEIVKLLQEKNKTT